MARFNTQWTKSGNPALDLLLQAQAGPFSGATNVAAPAYAGGTMGILMDAGGVGERARRARQANQPPAGAIGPAPAPPDAGPDSEFMDPFAADLPVAARVMGEASPRDVGGLMGQLGRNFSANVGGLGGALMSAGEMFGQMAMAAAQPGPGGVGNAVAGAFGQSVAGLQDSFARNRGRVDERATREYIDQQLADPNLGPDERAVLESYRNGDRDLATLQLQLQRIRAAGGPKPLTAEQQRVDSQRRRRWAQFAAGETGDLFDPSLIMQEGSLLNDAFKKFHGETDAEYDQRLAYGKYRSSLENLKDEPVPMDEWMNRTTGQGSPESSQGPEAGEGFWGFLSGDSESATERARVGSPIEAPIDELEAGLMSRLGMAPQGNLAQRAFGLDPNANYSGFDQGALTRSYSSQSMSDGPLQSTLRRQQELLQGTLDRTVASFGRDDFEAEVQDPYKVGQDARQTLMGVPGDFRRAWQNTRY